MHPRLRIPTLFVLLCCCGFAPAGAADLQAQIDASVARLHAAIDQAYADVGLTRQAAHPQAQVQAPPPGCEKARPVIEGARNRAARELAALGPAAVPLLLRAEDKGWEEETAGVFDDALVKMGRPAVPALLKVIEDPDSRVQAGAVGALGRIGDPRAVASLLRSLSSPDTGVASTAIEAFTLRKEKRAVEPLLRLLQKPELRADATRALGFQGDRRAVAPLKRALGDWIAEARLSGNWEKDELAMRCAGEALSELAGKAAIPLLEDLLHSGPQRTKAGPEYLVAEAAAEDLRQLGVRVEGDRKGGYRVVR